MPEKSATTVSSLAYSIPKAAKAANLGRSTLYQEIADGRLIARKARGRTIVLHEDLMDYLGNLPRAACAEKQNDGDLTPDAPDNQAPGAESGKSGRGQEAASP